MAWARAVIAMGEHEAAGFFRAGPPPEAIITWIEDVSVGDSINVCGAPYRVVSVRDPGGRRETLELGLTATSEPPAGPVRKRRGAKRGDAVDG